MLSVDKIIAHGELKLFVKETGKTLAKKNLVIKNSPHISALSLGGDINTTTIKIASWGDTFSETPNGSYYNMTTLESLEDLHAIDGNHTIKTVSTTGHSYPASKAIRFTFEYDRNTAPELVGKNLIEFGLYFNDILYSRVALTDDNYLQNWMTVVGEWTIIFMSCSGGFSNYLLNQYEISSLWGMDAVNSDFKVVDYAGRNDLLSELPPAKLISSLVGINPYVNENDFIHRDSLCSFYSENDIPNILGINNSDIYNKTLDLKNKFTLWQWFKFKETSVEPFILPRGGKWILFSKWAADNVVENCSYRLYLERSSEFDLFDITYLKFDINDGGTIITLQSPPLDVDPLLSINLLDVWCLAVVSLDLSTQKLTLYLNDQEMDSQILTNYGTTPENDTSFFVGAQQQFSDQATSIDNSSIFKGFIDETAISPEIFNRTSITLLWNNGYGDFYNP